MFENQVFGICHQSVIPLRTEPTHKAQIANQLLFGDIFAILKTSEDGTWSYVKNEYDDYSGWIDIKQYKDVSKEYVEKLQQSETVLAASLVNHLNGETRSFPVLFGSPLPFYKNGSITIGNETYQFEGKVIVPLKNNDFKFLEQIAFNYLRAPYLWGGKGPFGIDCSGFVQQVYRFCGYKLPRDAYQQAECGISVTGEPKPGDLAFFNNEKGKIIHVGIVLENNQIIHASGEVRVDMLDESGIYNAERKIYTHKVHSIKRIFS